MAERNRDRDGAVSRSETADDDPPRALAAIGRFGVYLAVASLAAAVFGVVAMYVDFQPYGNAVTALALAGVSVAMVLGMLFQAWVDGAGIGSKLEFGDP